MAVQFESVGFAYEEKPILENFTFSFADQGFYTITGPSGGGKTTILHLLAGLLRPNTGSIQGTQHKRIAVVFQEDRLLDWMTIEGNIEAVLPKGHKVDVKALLKKVGLEVEGANYPSSLSGGMKRRLAIARAIAFDGEILLMDEPFKGLDPQTKGTMMELVAAHGRERLTIMVTHDIEEAVFLSDVILPMEGIPLQLGNVVEIALPQSQRQEEQTIGHYRTLLREKR